MRRKEIIDFDLKQLIFNLLLLIFIRHEKMAWQSDETDFALNHDLNDHSNSFSSWNPTLAF